MAKIHGYAHAVICNRPYFLIAWCYAPLNRKYNIQVSSPRVTCIALLYDWVDVYKIGK